jgi:hypothetical protein
MIATLFVEKGSLVEYKLAQAKLSSQDVVKIRSGRGRHHVTNDSMERVEIV